MADPARKGSKTEKVDYRENDRFGEKKVQNQENVLPNRPFFQKNDLFPIFNIFLAK